jgi:co-chaperonin GroES (HSP10)
VINGWRPLGREAQTFRNWINSNTQSLARGRMPTWRFWKQDWMTMLESSKVTPLRSKEASLGNLGDVRLDLVPSLDECKPGIRPVEYNVIVAPAAADETRDSAGMAMQVGRIVSVSPIAFNFERWPDGAPPAPKAGDMVWFARYAGHPFEGRDGRDYRIIQDKDINAVIDE